MANACFHGEVFINRSLQVVIPCYVRAQRRSIRGNYVMRLNLGAAAAIIELECGVNLPTRTVGVHLRSCRVAIAYDRVTQGLLGSSVGCPQQRGGKNEKGERDDTKSDHGSVLCSANRREASFENWRAQEGKRFEAMKRK